MENWTELKLTISAEQVDAAAAIAQMTVPYGIYIEDYSNLEAEVEEIAHIDLIDEELLARSREQAIIHIYVSPEENPAEAVSYLKGQLPAAGIPFELELGSVREEDWANEWKRFYHPLRVGKKLLICPSWEDRAATEGDIKITLDPGMAFGTGTHETTRLCMALLEEHVTSETEMLDVGCGSGILAVTALLLGAKRAVGVDIDELAVKVAEENAVRNGVSERLSLICGDITKQVEGRYDVICANIVADVIIRMSKDICSFMKPGSVLLCSGIIEPREQEVLDALAACGLTHLKTLREKGWVATAFTLR